MKKTDGVGADFQPCTFDVCPCRARWQIESPTFATKGHKVFVCGRHLTPLLRYFGRIHTVFTVTKLDK